MTGRRALPLVAGACLTAFALLAGGTQAGWTGATIVNGTVSAKSGRLSFTHTYAGQTCSGVGPVSSVECAGGPATLQPATSAVQNLDDTLQNDSTGGASYTQQVRVVSCAPAQFADSRGSNADPMLPRFRVGRQAADKWGTTSAASFDGSDDYAADVVPTTTATWAGGDYTVGVWFKAAAGSTGGGLLSLNASPTSTTTMGANPTLYLNSGGRVHFKSDGLLGIPETVVSANDYRDGSWHLAVVSVDRTPLLSLTDIRLYVDGAQVASRLGASLLTGTLSDSYWHLGWTDTTALSSAPSPHFTGSLSGAFVTRNTAMSSAAVSGLASTASAAAYSSALAGATHLWMLGEPATTTYAAAVGFVSGGAPCSHVRLAWTLGATTAFTATPLDQLPTSGWRPTTAAAAPAPGSTQTLRTSYSRIASGYDGDVTGLELVTDLQHRVGLVGAAAWTVDFRWAAMVFLA